MFIKIKINQDLSTPFGSYKKNEEIEIKADSFNIPVDLFWRNRLKDSQIDKCIEIINDNEKDSQIDDSIEIINDNEVDNNKNRRKNGSK
jgi:hypothetical protein